MNTERINQTVIINEIEFLNSRSYSEYEHFNNKNK